MDKILEYIVPVVFLIIWLISGFVNKAKEGSESKRPRRSSEPEPNDPVSETAREIREEIRRKIAERQAEGQETTQPQQRRYDPNKPYYEQDFPAQQYQDYEEEEEIAPPPPLPQEVSLPQPELQPQQSYNPYSYEGDNASGGGYKLDALKKQIAEQQKKQANEAREHADAIREGSIDKQDPYRRKKQKKDPWEGAIGSERPSRRSPMRDDITSLLKDPLGARKGFLYCEILGQPVGSRRNDQTGPFWK